MKVSLFAASLFPGLALGLMGLLWMWSGLKPNAAAGLRTQRGLSNPEGLGLKSLEVLLKNKPVYTNSFEKENCQSRLFSAQEQLEE